MGSDDECELEGPLALLQGGHSAQGGPQRGKIVNIASHCGIVEFANIAPYNCAKHGLVGLTRTLAAELAAAGINVNAICPASTHTPMLEGAFKQAGTSLEAARERNDPLGAPSIAPGELIPPEYMSKVVAFLASDDSKYLHGRSILVGSTTALVP